MSKKESAWKTMINYYKEEHQAIHAPMVYGDLWVQTKSRQRFVFGLTADAQAALGDVLTITTPANNVHVNAGETLITITGTKATKQLASPFNITVQEINTDLADQPALIDHQAEKDNWLAKVKAD